MKGSRLPAVSKLIIAKFFFVLTLTGIFFAASKLFVQKNHQYEAPVSEAAVSETISSSAEGQSSEVVSESSLSTASPPSDELATFRLPDFIMVRPNLNGDQKERWNQAWANLEKRFNYLRILVELIEKKDLKKRNLIEKRSAARLQSQRESITSEILAVESLLAPAKKSKRELEIRLWEDILLYANALVLLQNSELWSQNEDDLRAVSAERVERIKENALLLTLTNQERYELINYYSDFNVAGPEVFSVLKDWFRDSNYHFVSIVWLVETATNKEEKREEIESTLVELELLLETEENMSERKRNDFLFVKLMLLKAKEEIDFTAAFEENQRQQERIQLAIIRFEDLIEEKQREIEEKTEERDSIDLIISAQRLADNIDSIDLIVDDLEVRITNVQIEIDALIQERLDIEENIRTLEQEKSRLLFEKTNKLEEITNLQRQIADTEREKNMAIQSYNEQLLALSSQTVSSSEQTLLSRNNELISEQIEQFETNLSSINERKDALDQEIQNLDRSIESIDDEISLWNDRLLENSFNLARKKQEKLLLERQLEIERLSREQKEQELEDLNEQINFKQQQIDEQLTTIVEQRAAIDEQRDRVVEAQNEILEKQSLISDLNQNLADLDAINSEQTDEILENINQIEEINQEIEDLEEEVENQQAEIDLKDRILSNKEEHLNRLSEILNDQQTSIEDKEEMIEELNQNLTTLGSEKSDLESQIENLNDQLTEKQRQLRDLESRYRARVQQLEREVTLRAANESRRLAIAQWAPRTREFYYAIKNSGISFRSNFFDSTNTTQRLLIRLSDLSFKLETKVYEGSSWSWETTATSRETLSLSEEPAETEYINFKPIWRNIFDDDDYQGFFYNQQSDFWWDLEDSKLHLLSTSDFSDLKNSYRIRFNAARSGRDLSKIFFDLFTKEGVRFMKNSSGNGWDLRQS